MVEMTCKKCGQTKPEIEFVLNRTHGREYRKTICKECDNKIRMSRGFNPPLDPEQDSKLSKARMYKWRSRPENSMLAFTKLKILKTSISGLEN
jgi:protein-arginine kinase activator protein McsA